jgi:hypothetical protein
MKGRFFILNFNEALVIWLQDLNSLVRSSGHGLLCDGIS